MNMHTAVLLAAGLLIASTSPALAADGVILIDQNRALAGNVTPGDAPGFPVTLSLPGSYKLSSNLIVPASGVAIDITADDVTIDLNGFGLLGAAEGSSFGITASNGIRANIAVRNGTLRRFINTVHFSNVEHGDLRDLRIVGTLNEGIRVGPGSIVTNNMIAGGFVAIVAGFESIITGNTISENQSLGIAAGCPSTIVGNTIQAKNAVFANFFDSDDVADCVEANNSVLNGVH